MFSFLFIFSWKTLLTPTTLTFISQEAEENAANRAAKIEAHAAAVAANAAMAAAEAEHIAKSPSDFSCHSYELFVGQEKGNDDNNKEKMSIRSDGMESVSEITRNQTTAPTGLAAKVRKVSTVSMSECFACNNFFMVYLQCCLFSYQILDYCKDYY